MSSETTVRVPPGNRTGLYYITLSNLPFQTSWQQLKDHVRIVCPVERVEVFGASTHAWVMVKGHENFISAMNLLNGGDFNGRSLIADGRNETEEVWIKQPTESSGSTLSSSRSPRVSMYSSPPSAHYSDVASSATSLQMGSYDQYNIPSSTASYATTPLTMYPPSASSMAPTYGYGDPSWYGSSNGGFAESSVMASSTASQYQFPMSSPQNVQWTHSGGYFDSALIASGDDYASHSASGSSRGIRPSVVMVEKCKIHIKHLPSRTTHDELWELLRSKAGSEADQLQDVHLPLASSGRENKGYATALFATEEVANTVIRRLHKYEYRGKTLEARSTVEGVSRSEHAQERASRHHGSSHSKVARGEGRERRQDAADKKDNPKSSSSSGSSDKKEKFLGKAGIVIADGSSKRKS